MNKRDEIEAAFRKLLPKKKRDDKTAILLKAAINNLMILDAINFTSSSTKGVKNRKITTT
jgi:hypothetical protein